MPIALITQENNYPNENNVGFWNGSTVTSLSTPAGFYLGINSGKQVISAIRFKIPFTLTDRRITSAKITFYVGPGAINPINQIDGIFSAHNVDDASIQTSTGNFNTALANQTTAVREFGFSSGWTSIVDSGINTSTLRDILIEVMSRGGWAANNHVVFYYKTTNPPASLNSFIQYKTANTIYAQNVWPILSIGYDYIIPGDTNTPFVKSELTVLQFISVFTNRRDVVDTLVVDQEITVSVVRNKSVTSTITVNQDIHWIGIKEKDIQHELIVSQLINYARAYSRNVQSQLIVDQEIILNGGHFRQVQSVIVVDQDITYLRIRNKTVTDTLSVDQTVHVSPIKVSVIHTIDVSQVIGHTEVLLNPHDVESEITVDQDISYTSIRARYVESQVDIKQLILATGTIRTTITNLPRFPASFGPVFSASYDTSNPTSASSKVAQSRPDTHYQPIRTSDPITTHPVDLIITITPQLTVTLSYPVVSPTLTVTLPAPLFGNREELQVTRIQRKSIGGDLKVFSDENWARIRTLRWQFEGVNDTLRDQYFNFLLMSLGLEIKIVDYENRTWTGFIVSPETESTDISPENCDNTIGFEFIGREI